MCTSAGAWATSADENNTDRHTSLDSATWPGRPSQAAANPAGEQQADGKRADMCLILIAHGAHERLPLVIAANRDEFHARPAAAACWWHDSTGLLAGRDLQDGGTWIGVHRNGRFAAVTNFAEEPPPPNAANSTAKRSRGELTTLFLQGGMRAQDYLNEIASRAQQYRGFNLIIGDGTALHFFGNRDGGARELPHGTYGMSNDVLNCDWPKVQLGRHAIRNAIDATEVHSQPSEQFSPQGQAAAAAASVRALTDRLFDVLADRRVPPDEMLPRRGRDIELERRVAPTFINSDAYGTRASTVIVLSRSQGELRLSFAERRFGPMALELGRAYHSFRTSPVLSHE